MPEPAALPSSPRCVAYVLKGFPRQSETFIASEIHRLETLGVALRIFVLKDPDEDQRHPVVDRIRAKPFYLPQTTSLSSSRTLPWLLRNIGPFRPALARVARRRPLNLLRAARLALAQSVRARPRWWAAPRKVYLKEFLCAVALADRVLADGGISHLHGHFAHGSTTVTWLAATITDTPFSFTGHAKDIYAGNLNPAGLLARKMAAARFVVTCTAANAEHLRALGTPTPVHTVYHGLSSDFAALTAQPTDYTPGNVLRVLGVGRLVAKKGFDSFIEACALLRRAGMSFEARIAGESGDAEPALRRLIAERGLESCVHLLGPLTPEQLYAEYRASTLFSLPCRLLDNGDRDGMPNVLLEAMSCAVPVVTTDISGIPELVEDGVNGLLVPPDDPHALAGAWLRLYDDPALARRLARAGQSTVSERFEGEGLALKLASLLCHSPTTMAEAPK
jgi:glycosyltransferase involved in cell wall biosynthesis